jgi:hypothetical protein
LSILVLKMWNNIMFLKHQLSTKDAKVRKGRFRLIRTICIFDEEKITQVKIKSKALKIEDVNCFQIMWRLLLLKKKEL